MEQIFLALAFIMIPLMMLWHSRKNSTELKDKEAMTFEEWCDVNGIKKVAFNIFMKDDDCLSLGKVSEMYETEQNL